VKGRQVLSQSVTSPRILIVDAQPEVLDLLQVLLEEEGYATEGVSSLEEAHAAVQFHRYHLIITDLFRPCRLPPFTAAHHLQQWSDPTPVGILTGWRVSSEEAQQERFAFLLPKPFDLETLLTAVATIVPPPRPAELLDAGV
jgi:two-component system response regulator PilR (NtrC family)